MTFVTLLVCLVINHYWLRERRLPVEDWFDGWYRWLERRVTRGGARWLPRPAVFVIVLVVLPLLPLALVVAFTADVLFGLPALLVHILVLLHALPAQNMEELTDGYLLRWRQGNYEAAYRFIDQQAPEALEKVPADYSCLSQQFFDYLLLNSFVRVFSMIFWYAVLGPVGVAAYWLLSRVREESSDLGASSVAHRLTGLVEWIPARITVLGFTLAGDFVAGFGKLRERLLHEPSDLANRTLLKNAALASMASPGRPGSQPEFAFRAAWELTALRDLLIRTQVVWIIILALLILVV